MSITYSFSHRVLSESVIKEAVAPLLAQKEEFFNSYAFHHVPELTNRKLELTNKKAINVIANCYYEPFQQRDKSIPTLSGASFAVTSYDLKEEGLIKLKQGNTIIAYFEPENSVIYMPYSVSTFSAEEQNDIYITVMNSFFRTYLEDMRSPFSWVANRERLETQISEVLRSESQQDIRREEERYETAMRRIEEHRTNLKREIDAMSNASRLLDMLRNGEVNNSNYFTGLDQIVNHENVTEVLVEEGVVKVNVSNVYAFATLRGETRERRFYIGNMRIEMTIATSEVRFFGDNPRRSHWTESDPHPHVNGRNGSACLGNASASIAELSSQKEIYALFLVCLDFLQNANPEDAAGKYIVNWDEVDEAGTITVRGGTRSRD